MPFVRTSIAGAFFRRIVTFRMRFVSHSRLGMWSIGVRAGLGAVSVAACCRFSTDCLGVRSTSFSKPRPRWLSCDAGRRRSLRTVSSRELRLSFDCHGSSLAVWNDSAADEERRDGICRWGGLNEAGGVVSGVGGLLWSFEDLMGGDLAELTVFPLGACLAGRAMLSRE